MFHIGRLRSQGSYAPSLPQHSDPFPESAVLRQMEFTSPPVLGVENTISIRSDPVKKIETWTDLYHSVIETGQERRRAKFGNGSISERIDTLKVTIDGSDVNLPVRVLEITQTSPSTSLQRLLNKRAETSRIEVSHCGCTTGNSRIDNIVLNNYRKVLTAQAELDPIHSPVKATPEKMTAPPVRQKAPAYAAADTPPVAQPAGGWMSRIITGLRTRASNLARLAHL